MREEGYGGPSKVEEPHHSQSALLPRPTTYMSQPPPMCGCGVHAHHCHRVLFCRFIGRKKFRDLSIAYGTFGWSRVCRLYDELRYLSTSPPQASMGGVLDLSRASATYTRSICTWFLFTGNRKKCVICCDGCVPHCS